MGNDIETVRSTGSDYWAAHIGGDKIKTDGLKQHTRTNEMYLRISALASKKRSEKNKGTLYH